jgi:hypothetical protein
MHFISLGSDDFSAFLFFKGNIKKLKKQVKRIRIELRKGRGPSRHSGAAAGFGD